MRTINGRTRLALCALTATAGLAVAVSSAPASVADANRIAQAYQNCECGNVSWRWSSCRNAYAVPQSCNLLVSSYYTCTGVAREQSVLGITRDCKIDVRINRGSRVVNWHYNSCRH
jgi:hypothetical protein